jgi:ERCC4-type nuclease
MSFYFIVDKRERPGAKRQTSLLSYYGLNNGSGWEVKPEYSDKVRFDNLECGDVLFYMSDKPILLIERKDIKDLAGCINSKSYKEQKFRMQKFKQDHPQLKLVYLIEDFHLNNLSDLKTVVNPAAPASQHIDKQTVLSALVSTMFRDGFFVHTTSNLEGTIAFIERLVAKLPTYPKTSLTSEEGKHEYLKQIDLNKQKNIDGSAWFLCALSQIPGVSMDKAKGIADKYKSMPNLIDAYNKVVEQKKKEQMLSDVPKIGKILSKRVYEYVMGTPPPTVL